MERRLSAVAANRLMMPGEKQFFAMKKKVPPVPFLKKKATPVVPPCNTNNVPSVDIPPVPERTYIQRSPRTLYTQVGPPLPEKTGNITPPTTGCQCPGGKGVYVIPRPCGIQHSTSSPDISLSSLQSIDARTEPVAGGAVSADSPASDIELEMGDDELLLKELKLVMQKLDIKASKFESQVSRQKKESANGQGTDHVSSWSMENLSAEEETSRKERNARVPVQTVNDQDTEHWLNRSRNNPSLEEETAPKDRKMRFPVQAVDNERTFDAASTTLVHQNDTDTPRKEITASHRSLLHDCESHSQLDDETQRKETYLTPHVDSRLMPLAEDCRSRLTSFRYEIQKRLCIDTFFDTFRSKNVISHSQIDRIQGAQTNFSKIAQLIDILSAGSQYMYDAFLNSLEETNNNILYQLLLGPIDYEVHVGPLCHNLQELQLTLSNNLRFDGLLPNLIERNVINNCQKDLVKSKSPRRTKAAALLDIILRDGSEDTITSFLDCLDKSSQRHLAVLVRTKSDELLMRPHEAETINSNLARLVEELNVQMVLPYMVENSSITLTQKDEIIAKDTRYSQCMEFADILMCRPKGAYQTFIEALDKTGQHKISQLLTHGRQPQSPAAAGISVGEPPDRDKFISRTKRKNSVYIRRVDFPRLLRVLRPSDSTAASTEFVPIFDKALEARVLDLTSIEFNDEEIKSLAVYLIHTTKLKKLRINCRTTESLLGLLANDPNNQEQLVKAIDKLILMKGELNLENCQLLHDVHGLIQYMKYSVALRHIRLDKEQLKYILMVVLTQDEYLSLAQFLEGNERRQLVIELLELLAAPTYNKRSLVPVVEKIFLQEGWLRLRCSKLNYDHIAGIIVFLQSSNILKNIDLTNCGLTDYEVSKLVDALPGLAKSKKIWLHGNTLSVMLLNELKSRYPTKVDLNKFP